MVSGAPTARFELVDHHGRAVTERDYAGSFLLVYFGFTHCRVVCPRSLTRLSLVLETLGDTAKRIVPLHITVDPERDTPQVMRQHLETSYPRFTGLTGSSDQIDAAKKAFRVFAERKADDEDPDGYVVPHTAISYLIGPDGSYRDHYTDAVQDEQMITRIANIVDSESARTRENG